MRDNIVEDGYAAAGSMIGSESKLVAILPNLLPDAHLGRSVGGRVAEPVRNKSLEAEAELVIGRTGNHATKLETRQEMH